jgi:anaerobic ribonucleoside-triphosphate reductase
MLYIIPSAEEREDIHNQLKDLPENDSLFKCHRCKTIFDIYSGGIPVLMALSNKNGILCPECKSESTELMCRVDSYSIFLKLNGFNCRKGVLINGVDICPVCRTSMCPECGNHYVVSWSRITGYLNDVSGWNEGKKEELIERKRYAISGAEILT